MRRIIKLMDDWSFSDGNGKSSPVHLPHTWNAIDGQDGNDDYFRVDVWIATLAAMKGYTLTRARMRERQAVNAVRKEAIAFVV